MELNQLEKRISLILQPQFPQRNITDLKVNSGSLAGDNFTCKVYSVTVTLSDKDIQIPDSSNNIPTSEVLGENREEVKHLVLKCFPDNPERCEFIKKTAIFEKELDIYEELIPELEKFQKDHISKKGHMHPNIIYPFPRFVVGKYEYSENLNDEGASPRDSFLQSYLILEDLRFNGNYRTTNFDTRINGLDFNHCKVAIIELAKFHALSLAYRNTILPGKLLHEKFKCMEETLITTKTEHFRSTILEVCASVGINILENEISKDSRYFKEIKQFEGKIMQIMSHFLSGDSELFTFPQMLNTVPNLDNLHAQNKSLKMKDGWYIFCHGDFWASNILFKYTETVPCEPIGAKFVDYQLSRENCLTTDLIFLFYMSTTAEFRSKYMNQLLKLYFDSFMEVCHAYDITPWGNFSLENLAKKVSKAKIWGTALALLALPIVYSGVSDETKSSSEEPPSNFVFEGVGRGSSDMNKILATRLCEIAKEIVDEGVI